MDGGEDLQLHSPEWESALLCLRGRACLPPPSHLVLAWVEICLMGFLGSQGVAAACTGAQWAPACPPSLYDFSPWEASTAPAAGMPWSSSCLRALFSPLAGGNNPKCWQHSARDGEQEGHTRACPGPDWSLRAPLGSCLTAYTALPCGTASAQSIWLNLGEML